MSPITTHILDISAGRPAEGVTVTLERSSGSTWSLLGTELTNGDGRCTGLMEVGSLAAGVYRIAFDTGGYFGRSGQATFYPKVEIVFEVTQADEHYHVPLLLSPFGYSTYRGS